jgi:hypothetical protein
VSQCWLSPERQSESAMHSTQVDPTEHTASPLHAVPGVHSMQRPLTRSHVPRSHGRTDEQRSWQLWVARSQNRADPHSASSRQPRHRPEMRSQIGRSGAQLVPSMHSTHVPRDVSQRMD